MTTSSTPLSVARRAIRAVSIGPCTDVLTPHGFRRSTPQFWRIVDGLAQCVNFQGSAFGSRAEGRFTVNLGISSAALSEGFLGRPLPARPTAVLWPVNVRIGFVRPAHRDIWWNVDDHTDVTRLGEEVAALLREHAVPWLQTLASRRSLIRAVEDAPRPLGIFPGQVPLVLAIFAAEDGDPRRARDILRKALDECRGKPFENTVRKVAIRLGLTLDP